MHTHVYIDACTSVALSPREVASYLIKYNSNCGLEFTALTYCGAFNTINIFHYYR